MILNWLKRRSAFSGRPDASQPVARAQLGHNNVFNAFEMDILRYHEHRNWLLATIAMAHYADRQKIPCRPRSRDHRSFRGPAGPAQGHEYSFSSAQE